MKISTNYNYNRITTFKAGHTTLFSDYDLTFLPARQHDVRRIEEHNSLKDKLKNHFEKFEQLRKKLNKKFTFIITSGRNVPELENSIYTLEQAGVKHPLPDRVIIKNGGDNLVRNQNAEKIISNFLTLAPAKDEKIDRNLFEPLYVSDKKTEEKRELIKDAFGWDYFHILKKISKFINRETQQNLTIVPTNNHDYNYKITMYAYPLAGNWTTFDNSGQFCVNMMTKSGETAEKLADYIKHKESLTPENIHTKIKQHSDKTEIEFTPEINGKKLNKSFDVKEALKDALENNDMIIVAGDSDNDIEMLNLENYVDGEITAEKVRSLPIISILVDMDNNLDTDMKSLKEKMEKYNTPDCTKFIYLNPESGLDYTNAIQKAIGQHADRNPEFKKALNEDLNK